jgi:hypothetical protein
MTFLTRRPQPACRRKGQGRPRKHELCTFPSIPFLIGLSRCIDQQAEFSLSWPDPGGQLKISYNYKVNAFMRWRLPEWYAIPNYEMFMGRCRVLDFGAIDSKNILTLSHTPNKSNCPQMTLENMQHDQTGAMPITCGFTMEAIPSTTLYLDACVVLYTVVSYDTVSPRVDPAWIGSALPFSPVPLGYWLSFASPQWQFVAVHYRRFS